MGIVPQSLASLYKVRPLLSVFFWICSSCLLPFFAQIRPVQPSSALNTSQGVIEVLALVHLNVG